VICSDYLTRPRFNSPFAKVDPLDVLDQYLYSGTLVVGVWQLMLDSMGNFADVHIR
jgi:hypothetical protein